MKWFRRRWSRVTTVRTHKMTDKEAAAFEEAFARMEEAFEAMDDAFDVLRDSGEAAK